MALPVAYHPSASNEILEIARQYEGLRAGLGDLFFDEVDRIEKHVSEAPRLYQIFEGEIRRAVMHRFPVGLFYLGDGARVVILGCWSLRQNPRTIVDILGHR